MDYLDKLRDYARRNRRIRALYLSGWTAAAIARKYGITRQRVYQVLAK